MDLMLFKQAAGISLLLAAQWFEPVSQAMQEFEIDTPARQAAFIAQIGHESDGFTVTEEYASGIEYDTGPKAIALGNTPEADGDGQFYKGRGLIQITGHRNYALCGEALGLNLLDYPKRLREPIYAARSAGWYWKYAGCNTLADQDHFVEITRRINGGIRGLIDRCHRWARARRALGVPVSSSPAPCA